MPSGDRCGTTPAFADFVDVLSRHLPPSTVAALRGPERDRLTAEVERVLARHTDDGGLLLAMQTWLVDARRQARPRRPDG